MKLGDVIKLLVNPVTGYEIDPDELVPNGGKWTEVSENKYEQGGLVKDIIGTAIRMRQKSPSKFNVNVFVNTAGRGIVTGSGEYYVGEQVTIGAIANDGFEFTHWDDGEIQNPRVIFVDHDMDFVANFKRIQLTHTIRVAVAAGQEDWGSVSGGGTGYPGDRVRIIAVPNEGYEFVQWRNDHSHESDHFVSIRDFDEEYIAEFSRKQYKIEVKPNSIEKGETTGSGIYDAGAVATLGATPYAGCVFNWWSDGSTDNPHDVVVERDKEYTAFFENEQPTTAEITVKSDNETMGITDPSGTHEYSLNSDITINAIPNSGFEFKCWQDGNTEIHRTITVTGFAEYVAYFQPEITEKCRLILKREPSEGGIVVDRTAGGDGSGIYPINTECEVAVEANPEYEFAGWYIDGEDNPIYEGLVYTFRLTTDMVLIAKFNKLPDPPKYRITVDRDPAEGGDVEGEGEYFENTQCAVFAQHSMGYHFVRWTEDGEEVSTEQRYEFTVVRDRNLIAEFEMNSSETHVVDIIVVTDDDPNDYSGGNANGAGEYLDGVTCYVDARNNPGYVFDGWYIGDVLMSRRSDYSFTVTEDTTLYAKFKTYVVSTFTVTVDTDPSGYATVEGGGTYDEGNLATVKIYPSSIAEGYEFIGWMINDIFNSTAGYTYSFRVVGNTTAIAVLKWNQTETYNISVEIEPDDGGSVTGGGEYEEGSTCTLTASPNDGCVFDNWTEDEVVVSTDPTYQFTVTEDRSLIANFHKVETQYTITSYASPTAGGSVSGAGTYVGGQSCVLEAISNGKYEFVNWTENGEEIGTEPRIEFVVNSNRTIVANFEQKPSGFTITANANPSEGGAVSGGGNYLEGLTCTLTAEPTSSYVFKNWTEGETIIETANPFSFTVDRNRNIVANFEKSSPTSYTIGATANPSAGGSVNGTGTYAPGVLCTLNAIAVKGYEFVNWTEGGTIVSTDATYQFTVSNDRTLVANFTKLSYTINATTNPSEGGSVSGGGSYDYGDQCTLTANATSKYEFVNWTENGNQVSTNATYQFEVTENRTLVANFTKSNHSISATAEPVEGGSVSGGGSYSEDSSCTVIATANTGYEFVNWTEDGDQVSTSASYSFTVTKNRTLVAHFTKSSPTSYTIGVTVDPKDSGTIEGEGAYNSGDSCTLKANANSGYEFVNWTENGDQVSTNATYQFTVTKDRTLVAHFTRTSYTISATANPSEGGSVNGTGTYAPGVRCTLNAIAVKGYEFVNWTEGGTIVSTDATYQFTVSNDRTLVANFTKLSYTISATANPSEGGSVSGGGSYNYGDQCTLTANATSKYEFVNWTEDGETIGTNASISFEVTENRTLVAHFTKSNHSVSATAEPAEGGSVSGGGSYSEDSSCTVIATANTGYVFVNWTEDGDQVSTDASYSFTVTKNRTLVAHFTKSNYSISATAEPSEGGSVSGGGSYSEDSSCTVIATANTGYEFVNWTEDGDQVSTNASYSFTVTKNRTLVAHFTKSSPTSYTIGATVDPKDSGTIEGEGAYNSGDSCTLKANANSGYAFVNWTENGDQVSTNATYQFTVTKNRTLVAHFARTSYSISATANPSEGGSVNGTGTYAPGVRCTLNAIAVKGYEFVNWTEGGTIVSTDATYQFTVSNDRTLVANFTKLSYTINATANPSEGGSVSGGGSYNYGDQCTLTANATSKYEFVNWTEDGETIGTNASISFEVTENRTLVAHFTKSNHSISATAEPAEGGSVSGGGSYSEDSSCTVIATANTGYEFVNWTEDGDQVSTNASYQFTVTKNRTLVAHFTKSNHSISATAEPAEGGSVSGGGSYSEDSSCTVIATANTGYEFVNWTEDGDQVSTNASYSFTVTKNRTLVAHFAKSSPTSYTIGATVDPKDSGTIEGEGAYNSGDSCTLKANANSGYEFVNWTENGDQVSTNATYQFTVTNDRTLVAHFTRTSYSISATANPSEGGSVTGTGTYAPGVGCTLNAIAVKGYEFVNWMEGGIIVSTNATYQFTVSKDRTLVANFAKLSYTVNATANPSEGGSVSGGGSYNYGDQCTLTANATSKYEFVNWTEDGETIGTNASISFEVTENRTLVAHFTKSNHSISATAEPAEGGSVSGGGSYSEDSSCTVIATANAGYEFVNWTEDGDQVSTNASYQFTVTKNRTLVAHFTKSNHSINATAEPAEGGSVSGGGSYSEDSSCTVVATANTGYEFVNWTEDGDQVSTNASYSFTVTKNRTLVAHFTKSSPTSYTIGATVDPKNSGTIEGGGAYNSGDSCTLKANANSGYEFVNWTENGDQVSTNATYQFTVTKDRTLVAHFTRISYSISTTANPSEGGSVSGGGSYNYGDQCTLTANATNKYEFVNWTENGDQVSTNATYQFEVTDNRTLVAHFTKSNHSISATAEPAEGGSVSGGGSYSEDSSCTVVATANTGYEFVNWTEDGDQVSTNASYQFTVTKNRTLVAHFTKSNHSISATAEPAEGGSVSGGGSYSEDSSCTVVATANTGYEFINWTEDGDQVSTNASYQFTVTKNRTLVAHFAKSSPTSYTIGATVDPKNSGTIEGGGAYNSGDSCTLKANANSGYEFVNWTENGDQVSTNATYQFTVSNDRTLVAHFTRISYSISATANPSEGGSVSGGGSYNYGDQCTLTANATSKYEFVNWTEDGETISTNDSISFEVMENRTLVAHFTKSNHSIGATAEPAEGGSVSGGGSYSEDSSCTVIATANTGYEFVNWTEDGDQVSTNASYQFTVTKNRTLVAHFTKSNHSISATAEPAEGGSVSGGGSYSEDSSCTVIATANTGYEFVNWTEDGNQVSTNASYSFTVTKNRTLVAHFTKSNHSISATAEPAEGGSVSGGGSYSEDSSCTVIATANTGYEFVNWTENGNPVSTNASYSFTVTKNRTLVAHFTKSSPTSYTIGATVEPSEGGSVSGGGSYNEDSSCTVIATANTGYEFVNWTENGDQVSTNASYSFTVTKNRTLVAHFTESTPTKYTVTTQISPNKSGTVEGGGEYNSGDPCTLRATAKRGYEFVNWTVGGNVVGTNTTYSFTVTENVTVVANFNALTGYNISVLSNDENQGVVNGGDVYYPGETCTIGAVANPGYKFEKWIIDGSEVTDNPYSFQINKDVNATAYFISSGANDDETGDQTGRPD